MIYLRACLLNTTHMNMIGSETVESLVPDVCRLRARVQRRRKTACGDIVGRHVETVKSTSSPFSYTLRLARKKQDEYSFCDL